MRKEPTFEPPENDKAVEAIEAATSEVETSVTALNENNANFQRSAEINAKNPSILKDFAKLGRVLMIVSAPIGVWAYNQPIEGMTPSIQPTMQKYQNIVGSVINSVKVTTKKLTNHYIPR